jgi:hypothetical protein
VTSEGPTKNQQLARNCITNGAVEVCEPGILATVTTKERKLLLEMFPALSVEIQRLLAEQGESGLAAQIPQLSVIERCRCGDDFCGMFYVLPKPAGAYGPAHRNVSLDPERGMLILDIVADKIAAVEVLYRDEVRQRLLVEFP